MYCTDSGSIHSFPSYIKQESIDYYLRYRLSLPPATSAFRIDVDRGYAEIYQYVKEFFVASMLMILAFRHRQAVLVAWSVFFGFLLLDDSFRLHERLGTLIGKIVDLEPYIGVERQVYGEVLASTLFGATLLIPLMALAFLGRQNQLTKCANATLLYLTICLVFFGVFIDAFKNFLPSLGFLFDLIEDGGEMIVMSAITGFVHVLSSEPESISIVSRGESLRPLS